MQLNSKYKNKSSLHLLYHTFFKFWIFLQVLFEFLWETSVFPRLPKFFWVLFFLVLARHSLIWIDGEIFDEPTVGKKILIFVYKISKTIIKHIIKAFQKEYLNEIWERQKNIKQYWKYNIKAVKFEWKPAGKNLDLFSSYLVYKKQYINYDKTSLSVSKNCMGRYSGIDLFLYQLIFLWKWSRLFGLAFLCNKLLAESLKN